MFTIVKTVREALKTFGKLLFGKLSTRIFESITMWPCGSDTVTVSVNIIARFGLHKISYIKNVSVDLTHCCFNLNIIYIASFRSLDLVLCDRSIII